MSTVCSRIKEVLARVYAVPCAVPYAVPCEAFATLKRGIQGSARAKTIQPNSATSQFFINLNDTNVATLDSNYSVFGMVISGMDVVDAISHVPIYPANDGKPLTDVTLIVAQLIS